MRKKRSKRRGKISKRNKLFYVVIAVVSIVVICMKLHKLFEILNNKLENSISNMNLWYLKGMVANKYLEKIVTRFSQFKLSIYFITY